MIDVNDTHDLPRLSLHPIHKINGDCWRANVEKNSGFTEDIRRAHFRLFVNNSLNKGARRSVPIVTTGVAAFALNGVSVPISIVEAGTWMFSNEFVSPSCSSFKSLVVVDGNVVSDFCKARLDNDSSPDAVRVIRIRWGHLETELGRTLLDAKKSVDDRDKPGGPVIIG
jgi:hypothetical protein